MTIKKITISITVLFTFVIFTEIAQAFNDEEKNEFRKGFIQGLTSSTAVEKKLNLLNFSGEQRSIARDYFSELGRNEKFIDYMVEEFLRAPFMKKFKQDYEQGKLDKKTFALNAMQYAYEVEANLAMKGLLRLSDEDMKSYLYILRESFLTIDQRYCRLLAGYNNINQVDEMAVSMQMLTNMKPSSLRTYYRLNTVAMNAELNDYPTVPIINNYQAEQANLVYEDAIIEAFERAGRPDYFIAAAEPDTASDKDICLSMAFVVGIARDLEGVSGEWLRAIYMR